MVNNTLEKTLDSQESEEAIENRRRRAEDLLRPSIEQTNVIETLKPPRTELMSDQEFIDHLSIELALCQVEVDETTVDTLNATMSEAEAEEEAHHSNLTLEEKIELYSKGIEETINSTIQTEMAWASLSLKTKELWEQVELLSKTTRENLESLRKELETDPLTGLKRPDQLKGSGLIVNNLKIVENTLNGKSTVLAFVDIDNFKTANDYFSHLGADIAIASIAKLMKQSFQRQSDLVIRGNEDDVESIDEENELIRFGGDEFVALITITDLERDKEKIHAKFEKINKLVRIFTAVGIVESFKGNPDSVTAATLEMKTFFTRVLSDEISLDDFTKSEAYLDKQKVIFDQAISIINNELVDKSELTPEEQLKHQADLRSYFTNSDNNGTGLGVTIGVTALNPENISLDTKHEIFEQLQIDPANHEKCETGDLLTSRLIHQADLLMLENKDPESKNGIYWREADINRPQKS